MITLDIESTEILAGSPIHKAIPTSCSIIMPGEEGRFYAWDHPEGNNCTKEEFGDVLRRIWDQRILTHNGHSFDIPNLAHHFGLPPRDPLLTDDTLFAAYLHNPYSPSLSLKPLTESWLGMPPDEQADLYDWIVANVPDCRSRKSAGAYISKAPVSLVGPYALSDTDRTLKLWEFVWPLVETMQEPYQREQRLAPILADIRDRGVRCDLERLKVDLRAAQAAKAELDRLIRDELNQPEYFNPGSDKELGAALLDKGFTGFLLTPTGRVSMSKESLAAALESNPKLSAMLKSRSTYDTLIGTFMEPWVRYAEANHGRIHASYNQVRNPDDFGTRTGRLSSSSPNFQNVPNNLGEDYFGNPYPEMRSYLLPEEGQIWVCGDFKNQEPRLTAHFEDGALMQAFLKDHKLDPYIFVRDTCGFDKTKDGRHKAKQVFLGLVYAMGIQAMADKCGVSYDEGAWLKRAVLSAIPDVGELASDCRKRFKKGLPIRTLGGRLYYCEPSKGGRSFEYKAINTLVQGSAADQTKEAMIYANPLITGIGGRLLGSVHDEWSCSVFERDLEYVHEIYHGAANALPCDVPMLMDIAYGKNWAAASPK